MASPGRLEPALARLPAGGHPGGSARAKVQRQALLAVDLLILSQLQMRQGAPGQPVVLALPMKVAVHCCRDTRLSASEQSEQPIRVFG
jgi:hypothetical protein